MATWPISPFLRSPFTDITGGLISHQFVGTRCGPMEMEVMECLEVYGLDRGMKKCNAVMEDFRECQMHTKQFSRFLAMRAERDRQMRCGKSTEKDYLNPRIDSY